MTLLAPINNPTWTCFLRLSFLKRDPGIRGSLCFQAALAQKTARSIAQSADWTTELMGLPGLLTNTSAGKQWDKAITRALEDCEEAIASLGSLTRFLRSRKQACNWLTCAILCNIQGTACTCSGVTMRHNLCICPNRLLGPLHQLWKADGLRMLLRLEVDA